MSDRNPKRVHSSSAEDSDASFSAELTDCKQIKKRQHLTELNSENMDIRTALERIEKRLEGLEQGMATKDDFLKMKEEVRNLTTTFMEKVSAIEGRLFDIEAQKEKHDTELKELKKKNDTLQNIIRHQDSKVKEIEREQNDLEQYSRRCHLRVFNVEERQNETAEDCAKKVCTIFTDSVGVSVKPSDIEVAHRTGRRSSNKPRPILVRFFDRKRRDQVLANRRKLKGRGTSIGEDLTARNYKLLRSAMEHSATMSAWSSAGKILAKVKNGTVVKISLHTNLDEAFRRAMSPGDISVEEDVMDV